MLRTASSAMPRGGGSRVRPEESGRKSHPPGRIATRQGQKTVLARRGRIDFTDLDGLVAVHDTCFQGTLIFTDQH